MKDICTNCRYYPLCEYCKEPQGSCDRYEKKGILIWN